MSGRAGSDYRRLPGRAWRPLGTLTLWIGRDHLLLVELRWAFETYRRFYFRDIQAVITRRTKRGTALTIWLTLLTTLLLLKTTAAAGGWRLAWGIVACLCFLLLLINWLRGPTCVCHLTTPLQTVELSPLRRLRVARRALDRIRPFILQFQGSLPAEVIAARAGDLGALAETAPPGQPLPAAPAPPVRRESGRAHEILSYLLLLDAGVSWFQLSARSTPVDTVGNVLFLIEIIFAIAALIRQKRSDLGSDLRRFAITALAFLCSTFMFSTWYGAFLGAQAAAAGTLPPTDAHGQPGFIILTRLSMAGSLILGVWGLFLIRRFRRGSHERWLSLKISP